MTSLSSIIRGSSKLLYQLFTILFSVSFVYICGEKAVDCFFYSVVAANSTIALLEIPSYGLGASLQSVIHCILTFGDAAGYVRALDLLQRRAKEHPHWRVLTQPNGGTACARNTGMRVSRGEYLMFVDSDDAISSGYIDGLMTAAAAAHADLAACAYESRTEQGRLLRRAVRPGGCGRPALPRDPSGERGRQRGEKRRSGRGSRGVRPLLSPMSLRERCACSTS